MRSASQSPPVARRGSRTGRRRHGRAVAPAGLTATGVIRHAEQTPTQPAPPTETGRFRSRRIVQLSREVSSRCPLIPDGVHLRSNPSAHSGVRMTIHANSPPSSGTSCCAREDHWQSWRVVSSPRHIAAIRSSRVIAHGARYASHTAGRWWRPDPICVDAPPAVVRVGVLMRRASGGLRRGWGRPIGRRCSRPRARGAARSCWLG
jgi:hypothetical protein